MQENYLYGFRPPKTLFEMTWEEAEETLNETDLVILPIGSVENHGPHLPLGNDALQVRELARRTTLKLADRGLKAVVGPLEPFGLATYHMPFPGTITLRPTTFLALVEDICTSLHKHGFRRFVLPLGHGGNLAASHLVSQDLMHKLPESRFLVLNWVKLMVENYPKLLRSDKLEGHAGEGETSRLLDTHPELVVLERAREHRGKGAESLEAHEQPLHGGGVFKPVRSWKERGARFGSIGNPALASADTGSRIFDLVTDWMADVIFREFG